MVSPQLVLLDALTARQSAFPIVVDKLLRAELVAKDSMEEACLNVALSNPHSVEDS